MRGESSRDVLRHLRTLYCCGVVGTLSDEQLLDRFAARRDETAEAAFAELVQRHGPMVFGVCRRILGDAHEAEDAFQATFLVLARKADSVLRREKVANWLYGVAVRTAREARGRASRRRTREERVSSPVYVDPPDDGCPDELRAILDEELARLPARYRGPVVLCELEGLSRPEAARRLDIPEGTLSSRLSRAKAQLRDRLARRGVTVPAVVLASALLREAQAVSLPSSLIEATVEAATHVAAGASATAAISASVASLSEGVLKTMLFAKLKGISLGLGLMTAVVSSAVVLAQSGPGPQGPAPGGQPIKVEKAPEAPPSGADRTADLEKKLDRILDALDRLSRPIPPSEPDTVQPVPVTMLVEGGSQPPSPVPTIARARSQPQPLVEAKPEPDRDQDEIPSPQPEPSPKLEPQAYSVRPTSTPAPRSEAVVEFQYQAEVPKRVKRVRQNPVSITDRLNAVEERLEHFDEVVTQLRREVTELRKQVGGAGPQGGEAPVRNPTPSP